MAENMWGTNPVNPGVRPGITNQRPVTSNFSTSGPTFSQGRDPSYMDAGYRPSQTSAGNTTYTGQGGSYTQGLPSNVGQIDPNTGHRIEAPTDLSGSWTDSSGNQIGNLPGYLQKSGLRESGSDFGQYQSKLSDLLNDPSKIEQTAGYQFQVDQGNQAINRSAAARGMGASGNVLAELAKYGQGMASQEYGNQVKRLSDLMQGSQQFGISSGYYDELNKNKNNGGGMRTGGFTQPMQYDPRGI